MSQDNNTQQERPLTSEQVMAYFSIGRSTLEVWIKKGMPLVKIGRIRRFWVKDIEAWLRHKASKGESIE